MKNPDQVFDNQALRTMLGGSRSDSWTRRLRELRERRLGGYIILSHHDRSDLRPGQYVFPRQVLREPEKAARISGRVRGEVLYRDAYTCQACGMALGEKYEDGRQVKLHVAHNRAHSHGGTATVENCFTLCSRCNEAESNIGPDRPSLSKTMDQVRRSPRHEKRVIYELLRAIFER